VPYCDAAIDQAKKTECDGDILHLSFSNEVRVVEFKGWVLRQNQLMRIEHKVRKASVVIEALWVCANAIFVP
jgi:hypothetical protein